MNNNSYSSRIEFRAWRVLFSILIPSLLLIGFLLIIQAGPAAALGSRYYVDLGAGGSNNGSSWANAYTNLQSALSAAGNGDEIWVATGVYTPTNVSGQSATFQLKSGVAVYGGFAGFESSLSQREIISNATVLSGDLNGDDQVDTRGVLSTTAGIVGTNAYHVVTASGSSLTSTAILDGFFITGGQANGSDPDNNGAGIWVGSSAAPLLNQLRISGSYASGGGGGVYVNAASPNLHNLVISGNSSDLGGGGLYNTGGASSSLVNVVLSGNSTGVYGGGMSNYGNSTPSLVNVTIASNSAYAVGGMFNYSGSPTLVNCLVWGNESGQITDWYGSTTVSYSFIQGGFSGTGNQDADPLFVQQLSYTKAPTSLGDYRLHYGSGAVDTGLTSVNSETTDVDDNPRKVGEIDRGAFEHQNTTTSRIYVDLDATGANNGTTWANAYTDLQTAMAQARDTEVWVAEGVYYAASDNSDRMVAFSPKRGVTAYGGFIGNETQLSQRDWLANHTVLSGDLDRNDDVDANGVLSTTAGIVGANAHRVIVSIAMTETAVLDGFYVTGGYGGTGGNAGAGLWLRNGTQPLLNHLFVSGNYGGGVYSNGSSPNLHNMIISGNWASDGGGMMTTNNDSSSLVNVLISGNRSGGGMHAGGLHNSSSNLSLVNVSIVSNAPGGIHNDNGVLTLVNCLIWGNEGIQINDYYGGSTTASYSLIQGGFSGTGNLNADPLFVQQLSYTKAPTSLGDYRLRYGSPAIDSGLNSAVSLSEDLDGKSRLVDGSGGASPVVDMGAYEWQRYLLTLNKVGSGNLTRDPDYPAYTTYDTVVVTATPDLEWNFIGWSGDVNSSDNPLHLSITGNTTLTGTFKQNTYILDVSIIGSGTVGIDPDQPEYVFGEAVTLTASADPGWSFAGWTGDVISSDNPLHLSITGNTTLTATFTQDNYLLDVNKVGSGIFGFLPDQPSYVYGEAVTITATPEPGWSFLGWSGDIISGDNPLELTITGNTVLTGTFSQNAYQVNVSQVGSGQVNKTPDQSSYVYGSKVKLTATPALGWSFAGWSGDVISSDNPLTLTITGNVSIISNFIAHGKIYLPLIIRGSAP